MITPELKDKILADIIAKANPSFDIDTNETPNPYGFDVDRFGLLLRQFKEFNLIDLYQTTDGFCITILVGAGDLVSRGGFAGMEQEIRDNLEKLKLEVEHLTTELSQTNIKKVNTIISIGNGIITMFKALL